MIAKLKKQFPFPVPPPQHTFDSDDYNDKQCHDAPTAAFHPAANDINSDIEFAPESVSAT